MKNICMALALLGGCVLDDQPVYDVHESAIQNGTAASSFQVARAVQLFRPSLDRYCSGTLIADDVVLTALHCMPQVGDVVAFFDTATTLNGSRTVAGVTIPPGTSMTGDFADKRDLYGNFADIAVLALSSSVPSFKTPATLAWAHPGDDVSVVQVGSGRHDGDDDAPLSLRQRGERTLNGPFDGEFRTEEFNANYGDSGGPAYHGTRLLGVTFGWDDNTFQGVFTNVPSHLQFILDAMRYEWPHNPISSIRRTGPLLTILYGRTLDTCAYACDKTSSCKAFNFDESVPIYFTQCNLLSSVDNATITAGFKSASK